MTPEEHHARAEKLIADAEAAYASVHRDVAAGTAPDDTGWRFLDTTVHLAYAHAALAAVPPLPVKPSFGPGNDGHGTGHDGFHSTGIVHYGDDDPTYDRM